MARISVEQSALIDPRYDVLGKMLGTDRYAALGRMIYIWNQCQDRETYTLDGILVSVMLGVDNGAEILVSSNLAEEVEDGKLRIKGTEGRIEWLKRMRETGKTNGLKGGRPSKTNKEPMSVSLRFPPETPPTPTPAPAPAINTNTPPTPPRKRDDTPVGCKVAYGEFGNVRLTGDEYRKLIQKNGQQKTTAGIDFLDAKIESKKDANGKIAKTYQYGSHYAVLKEGSWVWNELDKAISGGYSQIVQPVPSPPLPVYEPITQEEERERDAFLSKLAEKTKSIGRI